MVPLAWDSRREEIVDKPAQHDFLRALIIKWLLIIPLHFRILKNRPLFFELRIPSLFSFSEKFPCLGNAIQLVPITFRSSPLSSSSSSPSLRIKQIVPDIINYNEKYSYEYDITSLIIKGDLLKNDTFTRENTSQLIQ